MWSSQWATQRGARWFPEPERVPARALGPASGDEIAEYAWFRSAAERVCIGTRFAMVEADPPAGRAGRRFTLDVDPGEITP